MLLTAYPVAVERPWALPIRSASILWVAQYHSKRIISFLFAARLSDTYFFTSRQKALRSLREISEKKFVAMMKRFGLFVRNPF